MKWKIGKKEKKISFLGVNFDGCILDRAVSEAIVTSVLDRCSIGEKVVLEHAFDDFFDEYTFRRTLWLQRYIPEKNCKRFEGFLLKKFFNAASEFELNELSIFNDMNLLKYINDEDLYNSALLYSKHWNLRKMGIEIFSKFARLSEKNSIISAGWEVQWIRDILISSNFSTLLMEQIEMQCNSTEIMDSASNSKRKAVVGSLFGPSDFHRAYLLMCKSSEPKLNFRSKLKEIKKYVKSEKRSVRGLSVYVGNCLNDLYLLLEVDIGILIEVVDNKRELVKEQHYLEKVEDVGDFDGKDVSPLSPGSCMSEEYSKISTPLPNDIETKINSQGEIEYFSSTVVDDFVLNVCDIFNIKLIPILEYPVVNAEAEDLKGKLICLDSYLRSVKKRKAKKRSDGLSGTLLRARNWEEVDLLLSSANLDTIVKNIDENEKI